jgi:hypothetical protein
VKAFVVGVVLEAKQMLPRPILSVLFLVGQWHEILYYCWVECNMGAESWQRCVQINCLPLQMR